jgi:hypothetical protein
MLGASGSCSNPYSVYRTIRPRLKVRASIPRLRLRLRAARSSLDSPYCCWRILEVECRNSQKSDRVSQLRNVFPPGKVKLLLMAVDLGGSGDW